MAKKQQSVYHIKVKGLNDIKSLNTEISKLNGQYDKLSKEGKKASDSTKKVGKSSKNSSGGLSKMAKGAAVAGAALVAFNKVSKLVTQQMKEAVEVFKGFEFEMTKVKAISGANDSEFKKLNKSAQELGRSTFFTAQQVAALQLNFSKLGFTSSEVLNVQEAALLAATATGEDLARTATVIGSTIRGFGLDATEGARVADTMAASFTQSALTLEKFQTSMTKVSSVAALLGFDLEETTAIMGVLTDAGIEASIAGTSLRNIFLKLGDPSSDLAKSIGFTVNSSEDMVREFRRMRDEGVNVEKMLKIVDVRQVQAIANMVKHIDKIEEQTESYRNSSGAAGEMAGIIGDSLQGATLRFQSALDGLRIVIVEKFAPALTGLLDRLAKIFNKYAEGISPMQTNIELMQEQQRLFDSQIKLLTDSNLSEDARRIIIKEINKEFKDYLPNLISEKDGLDEIVKASDLAVTAMTKRVVAMQFEQEQKEILDKRRAASEHLANMQIAESRGELSSQQEGLSAEAEARLKGFEDLAIGLSKSTLESTEGSIEELTEKYKLMAQELGFAFEDLFPDAPTPDENNNNGDGGDGEGKTQLEIQEEILQRALLDIKKDFLGQEEQDKNDLNARLLASEIIHLKQTLTILKDGSDEKFKIEQRLTDLKIKLKEDEAKAHKKSEEEKNKALEKNIATMKETGKLLMQIGEQEGENSKIRAIGIKITQAAAVAEGIHGLTKSFSAISEQGLGGDPFTAILRVAAMAAQLASVISNLKALTGGGGSGDSEQSTSTDVKFEQGGLTRGGMFVGNSHANGGVKFRVGGRIHEAEGGEAIINKKSTSMFRPVLSAINSYNGNGVKFADGGLLNSGEKFAMGGELRSAQQLVSGGMGTSKVVIVESDMTEVQNRISAIESQATF
jgi:TP901 family phage tail tape measure protein